MATKPVIVGADGSRESQRAVEWAAREAVLRTATLSIVAVPVLPPRMTANPAVPGTVSYQIEQSVSQALAGAGQQAAAQQPGLAIETHLVAGAPAEVLVAGDLPEVAFEPGATTITRRAKSLNWPRRLPSSVPATPGQLPASRLRASLRTFVQRSKALTWPNRWRNSVPTAIEELQSVSKRAALFVATFTRQAKHFKWPNRSRTFAVAAVAVVIAFAATMAYRHGGPSGSLESATLPKSAPVDQQLPVPKPLPGKGTSGAYTATIPAKGSGPARTAFKRVRVGPNEVDYLADDVTVRTFSDKVAVKRARVSESRIAHIGNDVTVRYFTVPPTPTRTAAR